MMIIESGHFYKAKGPTKWSQVGWNILESIKRPDDRTLLFVDDVHELSDVSQSEARLPSVTFSPNPDYLVLESEAISPALEVFGRLQGLPNGSRPKEVLDEMGLVAIGAKWRGFPILGLKGPKCVLLDAGLMLKKHRLGFDQALNILPFFYEEEQKRLLQIVKKVIPEIKLEVLLYGLEGNFWKLPL